jgi:hypothetical protein
VDGELEVVLFICNRCGHTNPTISGATCPGDGEQMEPLVRKADAVWYGQRRINEILKGARELELGWQRKLADAEKKFRDLAEAPEPLLMLISEMKQLLYEFYYREITVMEATTRAKKYLDLKEGEGVS